MNTAEILDLKATALTGAVKLTWEVSSTSYLQGFVVVVTQNGKPLNAPRVNVAATAREATVAVPEGTGYTFNVEAIVAQGGKVVACNPLPVTPPPPPPSTLQVGLIGLCGRDTGFVAAQQHEMEAATGIKADRIDVFGATPTELAVLERCVATGAKILPIYDPRPFNGVTPAEIEADMKNLAPVMQKLGLTVVECSNEPYFEYEGNLTATEYAVRYQAMVKGLQGTGINVLAKGWGDYDDGGTWSQCAAGRGWCVDFAAVAGVPWGWAEHYYGTEAGGGVLGGGAQQGWASVATMEAYRAEHKLTAPLWITETGLTTPGQVTEAEQATDLKTRIETATGLGVSALFIFCAIGEFGLWNNEFAAKPSVAAVAEAVKALT